PSMTANVVVEVATVPDVLRIPNSSLRFKPDTPTPAGDKGRTAGATGAAGAGGAPGAADGAGAPAADQKASGTGGPGGGGAGGGGGRRRGGAAGGDGSTGGPGGGGGGNWSGQGGAGHGGGRRTSQTVYVLTDTDTLKPVSIRTGLSDGRFTQVVSGDLQPGAKIVTGLATVKVQTPAGGGAGGRPPGLGRF
ncbi:MAG TPA: hypothetical protein VGR07_09460, partial [Thermoanaerobaculia bacterium]|nr:hypothetical protein [Thermoanaerobaculia bacterium]